MSESTSINGIGAQTESESHNQKGREGVWVAQETTAVCARWQLAERGSVRCRNVQMSKGDGVSATMALLLS